MINTLRLRRAALLAAIVPLFTAGCEDIFGSGEIAREREELADARALWARNGTPSYEMVVTRVCYCGSLLRVRVRVQNGAVVSRVDAETGEPLPAFAAPLYDGVDTVEELFAFIDEGLDDDPHRADASYDPDRGHPLEAFFDPQENVADEESGFIIHAFTPLPVAL